MERPSNSLTTELEAMAAIGRALDQLSDPAARQRVLRWAAERFAVVEAAPAPSSESLDVPADICGDAARVNDADLAVDTLTDIFEADEPQIAAAAAASSQPLDAVLRSFAADFQRFTEAWKGATA